MAKNYEPTSPFYYDQMMANNSNTVRIYKKPKGSPTGQDIEVIRGIYRDDFTFGVQNQWQSGGSSILKMVVDTIGDMITGRDTKAMLKVAGSVVDMAASANAGTGNWIEAAAPKAKEWIAKGEGLANSHIFSADDYFKSFKGSQVTLPTSLSFSLLSDNDQHDVFDDLSALLDVSVGDFETQVMGFVGVQAAPNGFNSNFMSLKQGLVIEGSIKIVYGNPDKGGFTVTNMIVSNVSFSFSKAKVLVGSKYRPLMVDVQMSVEPARMISRNDLTDMLQL